MKQEECEREGRREEEEVGIKIREKQERRAG